MSNQPYYPSNEGKQLLLFTNLQTKIAGYYTQLEIPPLRQAKLTLVLAWLIWGLANLCAHPAQKRPRRHQLSRRHCHRPKRSATSAAPPIPPTLTAPDGTPFFGMLTWLFEEIARWKTAEGWTDIIGKDLGIIGASSQPHVDPPALTEGNVAQNSIELLFTSTSMTASGLKAWCKATPPSRF